MDSVPGDLLRTMADSLSSLLLSLLAEPAGRGLCAVTSFGTEAKEFC
jgi:hypothetical protein